MGAEIDTFIAPSDGMLTLGRMPREVISVAGREPAPVTRARTNTAATTPSTPATSLTGVLFDLDDVLYDASAWDRWLSQIFGRLSLRAVEAAFTPLWRDSFLPAIHRGQQEFQLALACCLTSIGLAPSHVEEIVAASRAQRRRESNNLRPFPGVRNTLERLQAAGIGRTVLANTDRSAQALRGQLDRLGLSKQFEKVISSTDLKASLCDDTCYQQAIATIQRAPGELLFVGHCPRDLQVAQTAGFKTVAFNLPQPPSGIKRIDRFEELLAIVLPPNATPADCHRAV
ncbi:MAG TPA: HAD family hydrolase [Pirellulales bacterium]|jgi:beta-phosphoglucomutase-like phosphatase (HAD superfamily)